MFPSFDNFAKYALAFGAVLAVCSPVEAARGDHVKVLYAFQGGNDGDDPHGGVIFDSAGNLYGSTAEGGGGPCSGGCGTVFKLAPDGTETVLYAFQGGSDGQLPSSVVRDREGNLYGMTDFGGDLRCEDEENGDGCGTVFKLTPSGTKTVLHAFHGGSDGAYPGASLLTDKAGNLFGTTVEGGGAQDGGTVFRIAPDGTETIVYSFCSKANCADGEYPVAALIADKAGNFYGTTASGGSGGGANGAGTVFKLAKNGVETVLHDFCSQENCSDGVFPSSPLIFDKVGNLYGTTPYGGANNAGVVFMLSAGGAETVLHSFDPQIEGAMPSPGVYLDTLGNLYGTLSEGNTQLCQLPGLVFRLSPDGKEKFYCVPTGTQTGVIERNGYLYSTGVAGTGQYPQGIVFSLKK